MKSILVALTLTFTAAGGVSAQSADWQDVIWREPQVRYLLADMTLGGNTKLYRDYATAERDGRLRSSVEAFKLSPAEFSALR